MEEGVVSAPSVKSRAIFILENASLHTGFVRKKRKILPSHEDCSFLLKQGKNSDSYRPDIVFEALRSILDSPLNKVGMVGAVFVKTDAGVRFEVKPHTRIPRTLKRFCGIMGLSYHSEKLVDVEDYLSATQDNSDLVFMVGTMVHGTVSKVLTNDYISVASYPLSAKSCVGLICEALEQKWKLAHG